MGGFGAARLAVTAALLAVVWRATGWLEGIGGPIQVLEAAFAGWEPSSAQAFCAEEPGAHVPVVLPALEVVDADLHPNDPFQVPRRGSLGLSLMSWVPNAYFRSLSVGMLSFSRAQLVGLNGQRDFRHIMEPFDGKTIEQAMRESGHNVTGWVAAESSYVLAPRGQEANPSLHVLETKWLAAQAPAVIASAGGEEMIDTRREEYFSFLARQPAVRAVHWAASFAPKAPFVASAAKNENPAFHLRRMSSIAEILPGKVVEVSVFHPQLGLVAGFARRNPNTTVVVGRAGGPLLCGRPLLECIEYTDGLASVARERNVFLKISAIGSPSSGLAYHPDTPPSEAVLAGDWEPLIHFVIEHFGPERVLFGTNAPFDLPVVSVRSFWNLAKSAVSRLNVSDEAKGRLLAGNARGVYGLL
mmetsp:Transcript_5411/g.13909  ORF Transcript_5411/g.13909 Transcript_5411/m.13909 type:complete len:414 (-) Transcript_5411:259-1500(-)